MAGDVEDHAEAVRESLEALLRFLPFAHPDWSERDSAAHVFGSRQAWDAGADRSWAVLDAGSMRYLGEVSLSEPDRKASRVNLAWWVRRSAMGRGVATAAARLVLHEALVELGFNRVEILVAVNNPASRRVAEKLGAVREGLLRERIQLRGRAWDAELWSVLLRDLAPRLEG